MHEPIDHALGSATWPEIEAGGQAVDGVVLVVPVGSCEQHGPHLPLHTDTVIAEALAHELARRRPRCHVTPPLAITASGEHQGFPGTLSIGTEAMTMVVVELARSADWADGIVFVNGHGGNADAMRAAAATMRNEQRRVVTWWPTIDGGDLHAGHTETSLMLAIAPEQVRRDRLAPGTEASIGELLAHGVRALSPNGVLGDATGADAEHGAAVFASLLAQLLTAVDQRFPAR